MDAGDLLKAARENWPKPLGLVLAWIAALAIASMATALVTAWVATAGFLTLGLLLTLDWTYRRRLKRCPKDKFGFVIAISVDDLQTYRVFERDFIQNFYALLRAGALADKIWVHHVPQVLLEHAPSQEDVVRIQQKTRAGFVLYGQVRTRKEDVLKHYLDLSGLVQHSETSQTNRQRLSMEFSELLPRRLIAAGGAELPAFELTSSISTLVAKYIIGIAAFLSGNFESAEAMYADALALAGPIAKHYQVAQKIVERIPVRRSEIAVARATVLYNSWRKSRAQSDLLRMGEVLSQAPDASHQIPEWKALTAISLVASAQGDLNHIEELVRQGPATDPVTHMNLAFFDLVRGDLRATSRHYRKACDLHVEMHSIDEVMSFLEWYLDYRQELATEINFGLGYISYYLLRDFLLSAEFFGKFLEMRGDRYGDEAALVSKWIAELQ